MIRRGQTTTLQERLEITERASAASPTHRLRLRWVARSGQCANGDAEDNAHMRRAVTYVRHCIDRDLV